MSLRIGFRLLGAAALAWSASALADAPVNALAGHPSPYLALHAGDPVAWQMWDAEVVERARRERKLLFVSIGYFSCHWCHVMQRESYQDPATAAILNAAFLPVKVDRELQPALDAHLIEFVRATRGHAGWPLNVFLTPAGHPLLGATYVPPTEFRGLLERLSAYWRDNAQSLETTAAEADRQLRAMRRHDPGPGQRELLDAAAVRELEQVFVARSARGSDPFDGGFGEQSKFPMAPQLRRLAEIQASRPDPALHEFLSLTLDAMAQRGLRDHVGGGFFRYATDPQWRVPHFEKMLYDNALMAALYLDAASSLEDPALQRVGRQTLDFMLRELWDPRGAFIASLSAVDEHDVEGGSYLWSTERLVEVLGGDLALARLAWSLEGEPTTAEGYLPIPAREPEAIAASAGLDLAQVNAALERARGKLLAGRAARSPPRDAKLLTGWNALALSALARGAALPGGEAYRAAGQRLRDFLARQAWDGKDLARSPGLDSGVAQATLEDYAFTARGLLDWHAVAGDARDLELAHTLVERAWRGFHGADGWRVAEQRVIDALPGELVVADKALPSPSALLLDAAFDVAAQRGDEALASRASAAARVPSKALERAPERYPSHIGMLVRHVR